MTTAGDKVILQVTPASKGYSKHHHNIPLLVCRIVFGKRS
jgi:hypothetical protein